MNEQPKQKTTLKTWILAAIIVYVFYQVTTAHREQEDARRELQRLHDSARDGITDEDMRRWSQPRPVE